MKIYENWGPPLVTQLMKTSTQLLTQALHAGKIKMWSFAVPLFCSMLLLSSCKSDEASAPAVASFTVDKTAGVLNSTTFTFTIPQVSANAVTLFPYGQANAAWGTVPITFASGSATVTFKYAQIGTFSAVVVTNNNTTDPNGKVSVKNAVSAATSITITNNQSTFSKFTVDKSISRVSPLNNTLKVVTDTVPFGTAIATLKANFTADPYTTVTVGSTAQVSGTTTNDFSSPVTYTVKSQDGASTTSYTASVYVIPVETDNTIKSVSGKATSTASKGAAVAGSVDNVGKTAVLYQPYGTPADQNDSIQVSYAMSGKYSVLKYSGKKLAQGALLDLTSSKALVAFAQDSTQAAYTLYSTVAPKLELAFNNLIPVIAGKTTGFAIAFNVIKGTDVTTLATTTTPTLPTGVTITSMMAGAVTFASGDAVDFTKPVKFTLNVHDTNIGSGVDYQVVYTATVTVLP